MKTLRKANCLTAVLLSYGMLCAGSNAALVDVFFYAGQSNTSGRVNTGYTPDARDASVQYYYRTDGPGSNDVTSGGQFTTLAPLASGYYGSEITMGRNLIDLGFNPAIVKISDGGTNLAANWNSRTGGPWWTHWETDVTDALSDLVANGDTPVLRGFFWLQGESDSELIDRASAYNTNFTNLVEDVSSHLNGLGHDTGELRFVTALTRDNWTNASLVRTAQQNVMEAHPRGAWFDTADLQTFDNVHYDAASIATIGDRFVATYSSIPEPSCIGLLAFFGVGLAVRHRRR